MALGAETDWEAELQFCDDISLEQQKNYQVWYHRQTVIEKLLALEKITILALADRDFALCDKMLEEDSKNYHVWSYRQWAVVRYGCWERELAFVERCLQRDVRNNSAWNQRFWIGERSGWWASIEICRREWDFALREAGRAPNNESPWLFATGILRRCGSLAKEVVTLEQLHERAAKWPMSVPLRALMVHYLERVQEDYVAAAALCRGELGSQLDTIHTDYWTFRAQQLDVLGLKRRK